MRNSDHNIKIEQRIVNSINAKASFIYSPGWKTVPRYMVTIKTLHQSKNPSQQYEDIYADIYKYVEGIKTDLYDSPGVRVDYIRGEYDPDVNDYLLTVGTCTGGLDHAKLIAEEYDTQVYDTKTNEYITTSLDRYREVIGLKARLKELGYYVDTLWSLQDVQYRYKCTDQQAYEILDCVVGSEYFIGEMNVMIDQECGNENYPKVEDND